ncbi:alpha/beta hydrolase [Pseudonocardia acaciae]|uniref:alpha/beta hydrolase n=1 Tax=Pseudonocardia acaciae TaxID=551276 RepID=UPI0004901562|nr:alpha/beta hydrolase [Pseudonocardia acaciae]
MTVNQVLAFDEPAGLAPRGTLVVLPGRGERPGVYERLGRRLSADAYRVRVVADATSGLDAVVAQVRSVLESPERPGPAVLIGSDAGALLAPRLAGAVAVDGLVLAGLPDPDRGTDVAPEAEPELRASCPSHQALLRDPERFDTGTLTAGRIPDELREPASVAVPVLGLHGENDEVSPLAWARERYAALPGAELFAVADGRHDVLNASHHRSVAATVVRWLERLRLGAELPLIIRPVA